MIITDIKPQVKRPNRYSIFIDKKYAFSLSETDLVEANLAKGQIVDDDFLEKIDSTIGYSNAKNACIRLLSYRSRSTGEIVDYLKRKKYEPEVIDKTIEFLTSKAFINDEVFARQWVDNRLNNKSLSVNQLKNELRKKKINENIIRQVIEDESINEVEVITQLIERKRLLSKYDDELKLKQYLSRRGFSYDSIMNALRRSE